MDQVGLEGGGWEVTGEQALSSCPGGEGLLEWKVTGVHSSHREQACEWALRQVTARGSHTFCSALKLLQKP